jgi:YhcH/YjgK/YiaL family protein
MKNLSSYSSLAVLTAFLLISSYAFSQRNGPSKWDKKTADKWVKSKVWAPGLKPKLDASVNSIEFAKQYFANKAQWDKAFEFLETQDLANLKPGKYPIDGDNVFAAVSDDPLKDFSQSNWEDHHDYIDLHYVIEGKEKIAGIPFTSVQATVTPYDATKDIGFYKYDGGDYKIATPQNFFLYFPTEAHRPHLKVDGYDGRAKKVVIKIRYVK